MSKASYELKAEARERVGKGSAREVRRNGKIPAVIYGEKKPPLAIALSYKDVYYKIHGGRLTVAPPSPAAGATPGGPAAVTSGASGGTRFIPPISGTGHGGGHRGGDVKPGDEKSTHQARPLQAVPGVPPALRGRAGTVDGTPDFLTGTRPEEPEPAAPLREDLWETTRPANPFTSGRGPR